MPFKKRTIVKRLNIMNRAKMFLILFALGLVALFGRENIVKPAWFGFGVACAQDDWQKEFEEVCSKTQDAMIFSPDQLKILVQRCDSLKPNIEKLDETQKKVWTKRLQLCRDLFNYVLESKEKK